VRQTSRRNTCDELVEDLDHLGTRPRPVCRFRDVQGGLVTGTHKYVRERPGRLSADAPHFDPALHDSLHQAEDVPLAHLPPVRPAQNRRPVDEGDAVNLRLDADVQPTPHGLPQRLDRIRDPGCGHFVGEPHSNIGLARHVNPRVLLDAASQFSQFTGPVRILWGEDDPFFRTRLGQQLSEAFPHASLTTVPAGRTFLPLDHPDVVASEIAAAAHDAAP
jgi:pimeloyl-ACP methyl ester carboxylesterase